VTTLYATQPREAPSAAAFATAPSGTYAVIVAVFCGLLLISNIAATKTITVVDGLPAFVGGGIFTDGGAFLFPLTYIVGATPNGLGWHRWRLGGQTLWPAQRPPLARRSGTQRGGAVPYRDHLRAQR